MNKIIGIIIIVLLLISGCGLSTTKCKNIALKEAEKWKEIGHNQGESKGISLCEENYKQIIEQFIPPKNCVIVLYNKYTYNIYCEGEKVYELLIIEREKTT